MACGFTPSKTAPRPSTRSNGSGSHSDARSTKSARAQPQTNKRTRSNSTSTSPSNASQRRKQTVTVVETPPQSAAESDSDSDTDSSSGSSSDSVPSSTAPVDDRLNTAPAAVPVAISPDEPKSSQERKQSPSSNSSVVKEDDDKGVDLATALEAVRRIVNARDQATDEIAALTEQLKAEKDAHANSNSEYEMSAETTQDTFEKQLKALTGERDVLAAKLADEQRAASNKIAQLEEKINDASALHAQAGTKHAEKVAELEGQVAAAQQERDEERAASQSGKDRFAAGVLNLLNNHIPGYLRPNAPTN